MQRTERSPAQAAGLVRDRMRRGHVCRIMREGLGGKAMIRKDVLARPVDGSADSSRVIGLVGRCARPEAYRVTPARASPFPLGQ